jgi:GT2 family glycosyltransferase
MVHERFPQVRLIASDQNLGFAAGNNLALRTLLQNTQHTADSPEVVLLLNPDTTVQPGALRTLITFMEQHPDAGMAGVQLRYPDGGFQHSAFRFPSLPQILLDFYPLHSRLINSRLNGRYPRAWAERGEPFEIDHPLGAAMMARLEAIQEVGLLDERFFMYCEEIDWCWRMKRAGWRIYCVPQAVVTHHEAQSTHQFRDEMFVELWRSRFRLFHQHYGPLFRWTARQLVWLGVGAERGRAKHAHLCGQLPTVAYQRRVEALRRVRQMR